MPGTKDKPQVLVVDDDEASQRVLTRAVSTRCDVHAAGTAGDALAVLKRQRVHLTLLDIALPDKNGIDLVSEILDIDPDMAIIMVSGTNDATMATLCMQRGALDYLVKPIDVSAVDRAIVRALRHREVSTDSTTSERDHDGVEQDFAQLRRERDKLRRQSIATLESLVNAWEAKDPNARGHSVRVADLAASIAHQLTLDDDHVERIRTAGRLHDIGYIGIRDDILNLTGSLTAEQYEHVKSHVLIGVRILEAIEPLRPIAEMVRGHHERWDGKGYPDRLAGEAISLGGRILAAAEIYDGLTRDRADRGRFSRCDALATMQQMAGTFLDPAVVDALVVVVSQLRTLNFLDDSGSSEPCP